MSNHCISCYTVIPEGRLHCPNCECGEKVSMEWNQVAFCDWVAKGKRGDFRTWKDGKVWKGVYRSKSGQCTFFFPEQKSLRKMQTVCEQSKYWE